MFPTDREVVQTLMRNGDTICHGCEEAVLCLIKLVENVR